MSVGTFVCVFVYEYIFSVLTYTTQRQSNIQAFSFCLPELKEAYNNNNNNNYSERASYEYLYKILFKACAFKGGLFFYVYNYTYISSINSFKRKNGVF